MPFCHLTGGQTAALMFIVGATALPKTPPELKGFLEKKDWNALSVIVGVGSSSGAITVPDEDDFALVGAMNAGLQNAYFLLALIDAKATAAAQAQFQKALDTHCWDWLAQTILSSMPATGLSFTGADLHQAYAANDEAPCQMPPQPGDFANAIAKSMQSGELVGNFFSRPLADFFANDFADFFKDTKVPLRDFLVDLGNDFKDAFTSFTKRVVEAFKEEFGDGSTTQW